jgi:predicted nucleic acid-binding protein
MKHKAVEVRGYNFTCQDRLFLDANIWLYMYAPQKPGAYWVAVYSTVFNRILKAQSQIYIDVLVLSEFINRYARMKWELVKSNFDEFRKFRNSPCFKPAAQGIAADAKRVLQHCSRIESGFSTLAIDDLLTDYATGDSDFNDQVITEICRSNGLTLITNDIDFKNKGIPVLTANRRLLR